MFACRHWRIWYISKYTSVCVHPIISMRNISSALDNGGISCSISGFIFRLFHGSFISLYPFTSPGGDFFPLHLLLQSGGEWVQSFLLAYVFVSLVAYLAWCIRMKKLFWTDLYRWFVFFFFSWRERLLWDIKVRACCLAIVSLAKQKDLWSSENGTWVHPRKWSDKTIIVNIWRDNGCITS